MQTTPCPRHMSRAREVVISSAVRTPIGKFQGSYSTFKAPDLGAVAIRAALERAGVAHDVVDEVIMGNVLQAGVGQNPARQAALKAGFGPKIAALTVNKVCGSSLKSVMLGAQAIKAGDAEIIVAGGMESMTNAPYLMPKARQGYRFGHGELLDSLLHDGLTDAFTGIIMGNTGEIVAEEFGISRKESDEFSYQSHAKAAKATAKGWFKDEIVPVEVPVSRKEKKMLTEDEGIRADTSADSLSRLRPAFREDGVVTAGNASQLSDGASAVVVSSRAKAEELGLPILATIRGYGTAGVEPERVMAAPIYGTRELLAKDGLTIDDIDVFEHNEAFAAASCAVKAQCAVPDAKFNVNGGAVAIGHPLGASGTRVLATLVHAMKRTNGHRGLATLCLGGGNAVSMIIERE